MTFDDFIEDGLGKATKLFSKLAETGPNAVKTRERLFLDLKAELNDLSRFERHHLIPALGDQKKTRALVKGLEKDNAKVAEVLAELDAAPRAGDAFLHKLTELQAAVQAHVRDERKSLLPAVLEALHRAQKAELDAAAAALEAAELKAADVKAAVETPVPVATVAPVETALETKAHHSPAPARHDAETAPDSAIAATEPEAPLEPVAIPAPLAVLGMLQTLAAPLSPLAPVPGDLKPLAPPPRALPLVPLPTPLPAPVFGVQAWTTLMQEAAAGAMMGYRLMMAYSSNTGLAALQTRLMKEQVELMTKSGAKMIEAAQRLTKTAGSS